MCGMQSVRTTANEIYRWVGKVANAGAGVEETSNGQELMIVDDRSTFQWY